MAIDDSGSATAELVLITPVLIMLVLLLVFAAQGSHQSSVVKRAADSAARAASLVPEHRMVSTARAAAKSDLEGSTLRCEPLGVDTQLVSVGRTKLVSVTVKCGLQNQDFVLLGNMAREFRATSTEVIDVYRAG